jgi:hypothetical protein
LNTLETRVELFFYRDLMTLARSTGKILRKAEELTTCELEADRSSDILEDPITSIIFGHR